MRCKFVHEEGLKRGQRCGSIQACSDPDDPMYGYCFRHAVAKKLVSDEKYKDFENKRVAKIIEAQKKRGTPDWGAKSKAKREKVEGKRDEEEKRENERLQKEEQAQTKILLHKILGDLDFDAAELAIDLKDGIDNLSITHDIQKFIFIGWHVADPNTRRPGTLKELCRVLGMRMAEGLDWISKDWFVNEMTTSMTRMMKLAMPYLQRMNLEKALGNDFNAFKEYIKFFGKKDKDAGDADWTADMSEDVRAAIEGAEDMN